MPKLTIQERRIQSLRQQLQGKQISFSSSESKKNDISRDKVSFSLPSIESSTSHSSIKDTVYLKNDLLKIMLLSFLAIGAQIILLVASNNNLINLSNLRI